LEACCADFFLGLFFCREGGIGGVLFGRWGVGNGYICTMHGRRGDMVRVRSIIMRKYVDNTESMQIFTEVLDSVRFLSKCSWFPKSFFSTCRESLKILQTFDFVRLSLGILSFGRLTPEKAHSRQLNRMFRDSRSFHVFPSRRRRR